MADIRFGGPSMKAAAMLPRVSDLDRRRRADQPTLSCSGRSRPSRSGRVRDTRPPAWTARLATPVASSATRPMPTMCSRPPSSFSLAMPPAFATRRPSPAGSTESLCAWPAPPAAPPLAVAPTRLAPVRAPSDTRDLSWLEVQSGVRGRAGPACRISYRVPFVRALSTASRGPTSPGQLGSRRDHLQPARRGQARDCRTGSTTRGVSLAVVLGVCRCRARGCPPTCSAAPCELPRPAGPRDGLGASRRWSGDASPRPWSSSLVHRRVHF